MAPRAPDVALVPAEFGVSRLHESLGTGKFALLSVAVATVNLPGTLRRIATAVRAEASPDCEVGHVYLVRPDAYVAKSTPGADTAAVVAALGANRRRRAGLTASRDDWPVRFKASHGGRFHR